MSKYFDLTCERIELITGDILEVKANAMLLLVLTRVMLLASAPAAQSEWVIWFLFSSVAAALLISSRNRSKFSSSLFL